MRARGERACASRRVRCSAALLAAGLLTVAPLSSSAQVAVPLPARPVDPASIPPPPVPGTTPVPDNRAPGDVNNREVVRVGFGAGGAVTSVVVDQTLTVRGAGDFVLRVPANAISVTAPPEIRAEPFLRRGAVLWQGFSPGERKLRAFLTLDPELEASRLPVTVKIDGLDGRSGRLAITIANATHVERQVSTATPSRSALAAALDATRAALARNLLPAAGVAGVPASLEAPTPGGQKPGVVLAPVVVGGTLKLAASASVRTVAGGTASGGVIAFRARLDRANPTHRIVVDAGETCACVETFAFEAGSVPPALQGSTFEALQDTLWQSVRAFEYRRFLGNPWRGATSATFSYRYVPAAPKPAPAERGGVKPAGVALASVALLLAGGVAAKLRTLL